MLVSAVTIRTVLVGLWGVSFVVFSIVGHVRRRRGLRALERERAHHARKDGAE